MAAVPEPGPSDNFYGRKNVRGSPCIQYGRCPVPFRRKFCFAMRLAASSLSRRPLDLWFYSSGPELRTRTLPYRRRVEEVSHPFTGNEAKGWGTEWNVLMPERAARF